MHRVPSMHASNYEHIRATTKHARSKNGNLMTAKCELLGRPSAVYKFSCINYKEDAAKMAVEEHSIAHHWLSRNFPTIQMVFLKLKLAYFLSLNLTRLKGLSVLNRRTRLFECKPEQQLSNS